MPKVVRNINNIGKQENYVSQLVTSIRRIQYIFTIYRDRDGEYYVGRRRLDSITRLPEYYLKNRVEVRYRKTLKGAMRFVQKQVDALCSDSK